MNNVSPQKHSFTYSCFKLAFSVFKGARQKGSIASCEAFGAVRIPRRCTRLSVLPGGWVGSGTLWQWVLTGSAGTRAAGEWGGSMGTSKQVGWEGDKKRKGKSQEQKDERAGSSVAAALWIPSGATGRDWDISRTPGGLRCSHSLQGRACCPL